MSRIYHIARAADWEQAQADGVYTTSSVGKTLAEEGFIHASQASQVTRTANKFYRAVPGDLVVLVIEVGRLRSELRYEDVPGSDLPYPHIYGPLNADAVIAAWPLAPGPDGTFDFTPGAELPWRTGQPWSVLVSAGQPRSLALAAVNSSSVSAPLLCSSASWLS